MIDEAVEAAVAKYLELEAAESVWYFNDPVAEARERVRALLEAASPHMQRVVNSPDGLLPGTVVQDKTGDVLKLMDSGEWWATDAADPSYVEYPATVLVEVDPPR